MERQRNQNSKNNFEKKKRINLEDSHYLTFKTYCTAIKLRQWGISKRIDTKISETEQRTWKQSHKEYDL